MGISIQPLVEAISQNDLNSIVNGTPFYDSGCGETTTVLVGADNNEKAFNFFLSKGLGGMITAAVVGNLMEESGMNPIVIQNPPGGTTHDPSTLTDPKVGWGIAQWTPGNKALTVAQDLNLSGSIDDLATQLDMVWGEMIDTSPTNKQDMVAGLREQTNLADAVEYFRANFEGGDKSPARLSDAQTALGLYGSADSSGSSSSTSDCSVQCAGGTGSMSAGLGIVRENVVCIAKQELAAWQQYIKSSPPYLEFEKYSDNNVNDLWCADFVSWVYKQAGDPFTNGQSGGWRLPAVAEIHDLGIARKNFFWHPNNGYIPRVGDIAIYWQNDPKHPYYHTAIMESVITDPKTHVTTYKTIGGDQGTPQTTFGGPQSNSVVSEWSTTKLSDFGEGGGFVSPDN